MNKDAINELEVKVAFLDDSLQKLSDEFFIQQRELEQLKAQYARLIGKLQHMQGSSDEPLESVNERPPHY